MNESINEKFAVYLIIHTIRGILKTIGISDKPLDFLSEEYIYHLIYSFRFRDISKEALILLTETIALMCGIKPYQGLNTISNVCDSEVE